VSWWLLVAGWLVLLILALGLVALVGLRVLRQFRALLAEVGAATDVLTAAAEGRSSASDPASSPARRTP